MLFNSSSPPRVLVLEDEATVALMIEDMLEDIGCVVAASAAHVDQAMKYLEEASFDVAVLDVNVGGTLSYAVAEALQRRGIPFIFSTGYGEAGLAAEYRQSEVIQKPFRMEDLQGALLRALSAERFHSSI